MFLSQLDVRGGAREEAEHGQLLPSSSSQFQRIVATQKSKLLGWSQSELALRAGLSVPTVKRLEGGFGPRVSDEARAKLKKAIEAAGIEFIQENGGGAGVRFRKRKRA
jgi:hypothetical protein